MDDYSVLPSNLRDTGDPVTGNPFPSDNPRYAIWQRVTLNAEEQLCNLISKFVSEIPTAQGFATLMDQGRIWDPEVRFADWALGLAVAKFDVWAKRGCYVVWNENDLRAYDTWLFNYAQSCLDDEKKARHQVILPDLRNKLIERMAFWKAVARQYLAYQRAEAEKFSESGDRLTIGKHANPSVVQGNEETAQSVENKPTEATSWTEVEIAFLSDERVEICSTGNRRNYNYAELGFEDRRNGNPNRAWVTLREMARRNGSMPIPPTTAGKNLAMIQKRIEEIRENLRRHFKIKADPIPFNSNTYQSSFRLSCRPSFNS